MAGRLDGKVALISGGARGMGAAHARGLADEGASVVIGDVLADDGKSVAAEVGDQAVFVDLDVTSEDSWRAAVQAAESTFGGLDILVNNAGIADADIQGIASMTLDQYMRVINVNQVGVFLGMHVAAVPIARRGGGSIVNISSVAGLTGSPGSVNYTASKFAVRGMTKCAAQEFASFNIRVNSIHPGLIRTPMLQLAAEELMEMATQIVPMARVAESEEVTRLVLFLASDDSSYCTGAEFVIDGGLTSGFPTGPLGQLVAEQMRNLL